MNLTKYPFKIEKLKKDINKEKFIPLIKFILLIITIARLIIYIVIIYDQKNSINVIEKIILAYYYNNHIKGLILNAFSKLNGIYLDESGLMYSYNSKSYVIYVKEYAIQLREYHQSFNHYFQDYNILIGKSFNKIYEEKKFCRIKGLWDEYIYTSKLTSELEYLIHVIHSINTSVTPEFIKDVQNMLFYQKDKVIKERVYTDYIQLLFYLMTNYDFIYKDYFDDINNEIISSYQEYSKISAYIFYILEFSGLFFIFYIFCIDFNIFI